jgi:hypothetical protein
VKGQTPPTSNPPASVHRRVRRCFSSVVYRHMRPASPLPDNRPSAQPNGCKPRWKATKRPFAAGSSARGLLGRRCAARAQTAAPVPTGSRCADQQSHELTASHSRLSSTTTRPDYQMIAHTALWRMRQNPSHGNLRDRGDVGHSEIRSATLSTQLVGFLPLALIETYLRAQEP